MSKNAVVIVAAGRGERLGGTEGPKQYRMIGKSALLQHTIACFSAHPDIDFVQVVIHTDDRELYDRAVTANAKLLPPIIGGDTRQKSCKAGIEGAPEDTERILIHDAARPFVSSAVITNVLAGTAPGQGALPVTAVADTVKRVAEHGAEVTTIEREGLFLAQTPQGFLHRDILDAHEKAARETTSEFTDDAAVAEFSGMNINLVQGDRNNFKITTQEDLLAAQERMKMIDTIDVRTGNGYDVHVLGPGDGVILCGLKIPHEQSLQGHSDADVGLHALTDALLGTIGAGDIGSHFPPTDPVWKGASSGQFLDHAVKLVRKAGGIISNLDVTIVCEVPKIAPHRDAMRIEIARIAGIDDVSRVSVKATTNERIGFIGRQEGIAALATATVIFGRARHV